MANRAISLMWCVLATVCASGCPSTTAPVGTDLGAAPDLAAATDLAVPSGDGGVGAICTFNRDCIASTRCACMNGDCACEVGPRGTGQSGIDSCVTGNDCASSLCVEGTGGAFICSGECATPADCGPALPRCLDVAFIGRICARAP